MRELVDTLPEDLRARALSHPAFVARTASFERLEFLGDKVLGLAVTQFAYERFPELPEGELTRIVNSVVSRTTCEEVARELGLGAAMVAHVDGLGVANAAEARKYAEQRNALAALVESLLGAAFLAFGFEAAARHALAVFEDRILAARDNRADAKSRLQELASHDGTEPLYEEVGREGPAHDLRFTVSARLVAIGALQDGSGAAQEDMGALRASGTGRSKQEAQQAAAAALLALIDRDQG